MLCIINCDAINLKRIKQIQLDPKHMIPLTISTMAAHSEANINEIQLSRQKILRRISEDSRDLYSPSKKRRKLNDNALKEQQKHVVKHNYHDHAGETEHEFRKRLESRDLLHREFVVSDESSDENKAKKSKKQKIKGKKGPRGGVTDPFPLKLHRMLEKLEEKNLASVVSWQPHGRSFVVRKPKEFVNVVMPMFFRQTKLTSFQRQLNLYGFSRLTQGIDVGAYYHELFLRGKEFLCHGMVRTKIKGTGHKPANSPETEPNFYAMPSVSDVSINYKDYNDDDDAISHITPESDIPRQSEAHEQTDLDYMSSPTKQTQSLPPLIKPCTEIHPVMKRITQPNFFVQEYPLDPQDDLERDDKVNENDDSSSEFSLFQDDDPKDQLLSFEGKSFHYLDANDPLLSHIIKRPDETRSHNFSTSHLSFAGENDMWTDHFSNDFGCGSVSMDDMNFDIMVERW